MLGKRCRLYVGEGVGCRRRDAMKCSLWGRRRRAGTGEFENEVIHLYCGRKHLSPPYHFHIQNTYYSRGAGKCQGFVKDSWRWERKSGTAEGKGFIMGLQEKIFPFAARFFCWRGAWLRLRVNVLQWDHLLSVVGVGENGSNPLRVAPRYAFSSLRRKVIKILRFFAYQCSFYRISHIPVLQGTFLAYKGF